MLRKKQLALAVALASGLGLSTAALANGGTYMAPPMPQSNPSDMSFYIGGDIGLGDNHWNNVANVSNRYGLAGGGHIGFQFNRFFAVQGGYTYLPTAKLKNSNGTDKVSNFAVDAVGKLMSPAYYGVGVFGKVGVGYLHSHNKEANSTNRNIDNVGLVYGAGVFFRDPDLIQHVVLNVSWTRFDGNPKTTNSHYQPYQDFYGVGLDYHFPIGEGMMG